MVGIILAMRELQRTLGKSMNDPGFRGLAIVFGLLLGVGTVFYRNIEDWSWLDSLYFCVVTLATVGYGDFAPQTSVGKIFTMVYMLLGVGIFVLMATSVARSMLQDHNEREQKL